MKFVELPNSKCVPALGLGTWRYGEDQSKRAAEINTLKLALDLGVTLIDTAEMYGDGLAEELIGEAIGNRRNEAFLVSKVYPHNATKTGMITACEQSLRRLKTDFLDLYLLHWRGSVPFDETIAAFEALQKAGKIRSYGVSNLDLDDVEELAELSAIGSIQTNQLLYNLSRRGIEWDLLPRLREMGIPVMAYSPIEQSRLVRNPKLISFAQRQGMTPAQAALGWLLAQDDLIVIPKTSNPDRLHENVRALERSLDEHQLAELDTLFPPPAGPRPLEML
ncbi:MAG: aldo/keto reductase [Planctomycetaceae bacterium]|nr:aldo/keto reductase [Planctomycetaceae bacterium]